VASDESAECGRAIVQRTKRAALRPLTTRSGSAAAYAVVATVTGGAINRYVPVAVGVPLYVYALLGVLSYLSISALLGGFVLLDPDEISSGGEDGGK